MATVKLYKRRITYVDSGIPNVKMSREVYMKETTEGIKDYRVYLDLAKKEFMLRDERKCEIVRKGSATSPHKLKLKAKLELIKLGIMFEEEKRIKSKTNAE